MLKRFLVVFFMAALVISSSGCVGGLIVGAGGAALWQSGKVISEETVSFDRAVAVVEATFKAQKITLTDKLVKEKTAQIRGDDKDGKKVAVDIFDKGPKVVSIEIRYGLVGKEKPARELLGQIKKRL
ncbi:MAG: DUF3568 family protein [Candidatus Omnitrophica bacterium]|nr:DUF3568 family protein [Candidatus Omnitrophota bacterium]MDD5429672.1 DUF3568 family protein [Candidatus Omnitrophota bacterium]